MKHLVLILALLITAPAITCTAQDQLEIPWVDSLSSILTSVSASPSSSCLNNLLGTAVAVPLARYGFSKALSCGTILCNIPPLIFAFSAAVIGIVYIAFAVTCPFRKRSNKNQPQ